MRKLFLVGIVLTFLFWGESVHAENECSTITFYSKKEWNQHQNLFDGEFKKTDSHFVNSQGVVVKQNIFGNIGSYHQVDSAVFKGDAIYVAKGGSNKQFPTIFTLGFGKVIQIGKIQFQIEAVNTKTKQPVLKKIYINADPKYRDGEMVYSKKHHVLDTYENGMITVDLKYVNVGSIEIFFETDDVDHEYTMRSFQILDYKIYEHTGWVSEPIENTVTKRVLVCANQAEFKPRGTYDKWVQVAATAFKPSSKVISDYQPLLEARDVSYDIGKTDYVSAYSTPAIQRWMGGYTQQIIGWSRLGGVHYPIFESIGPSGRPFPYIQTSANRGVIYRASPRYWVNGWQSDYYVKSYDAAWCNDVTGSRQVPCYKRAGHSSNSRYNVYDVDIISYRNVVNPQLRAIKSTKYTLINSQTGARVPLVQARDEVQTFQFNETGKWQIECEIMDLANNKGIKKSAVFLIDNEKPGATISATSEELTQPFALRIVPFDQHSRVKKWRYSVSRDGGNTFDYHTDDLKSKGESYLIQSSGRYVVKVYVEDWAGNTNIITSSLFVADIDKVQLETILVPAYELHESNTIYMKYQCNSCTSKPQILTITQGNQTIGEVELKEQREELIFDFVPNQVQQTTLSFNIDKDKLDLIVYEKSREFKESEEDHFEFKGIVASGISNHDQQHNYYETLVINYRQNENQIFSGQGIESKVSVAYGNECARIKNFACVYGDEDSLRKGNIRIHYQDGANVVANDYVNGNEYTVELLYDEEAKEFVLPQFYLDKKKGTVYQQLQDDYIDGGRKWYTSPLAQLKEYPIIVDGVNFGVNEFSWRSKHHYSVVAYFYDTYHLRFVESQNPFPNRESELWKRDHSWFNELDMDQSIHQETFN